MIVIVTGVPGSGKTYFAVKTILSLLEKEDCLVFSNISGLTWDKISSYFKSKKQEPKGRFLDISSNLSRQGKDFFLHSNFEEFVNRFRAKYGDKKFYFFIDECQRYLSSLNRLSPEIIYTFDYHRHYNVDIYLISQNIKKISPMISTLAEYEIRFYHRSKTLFGRLKYVKQVDGIPFEKKSFKPKPEIFACYSSSVVPEKTTYSSPILRLLVILFLVLSFSIYLFYRFFTGFGSVFGVQKKRKIFISAICQKKKRSVPPSRNSTNSTLRLPFFYILDGNLYSFYRLGVVAKKNQPFKWHGVVYSSPAAFKAANPYLF